MYLMSTALSIKKNNIVIIYCVHNGTLTVIIRGSSKTQ